MDGTHQLEAWRDLYVMLGTSSAALLGLLYVVTSLHLEEIANDAVYRGRARSNSLYLLITLVEAGLILTPLPLMVLGIAVVAVNLAGLWINIINFTRFFATPQESRRGGMRMYRAIFFLTSFTLATVGGACLIVDRVWGLYLVTFAYFTLLVVVSLNGWSIMLGIGQAEGKAARDREREGRKQKE